MLPIRKGPFHIRRGQNGIHFTFTENPFRVRKVKNEGCTNV